VKRRRKFFRKFDTSDEAQLKDYQDLVDNVMARITDREKVIETTKYYSEEGHLTSTVDRLCFIVHWEEDVI
jgi:hypothetical protein